MLTTHFIPKNTGWSEILPQLDGMVKRAGVKNNRKDYTPSTTAQYGLYSVKIRLPVSGPYPNIVNLIREIETSETIFIIESIDVRGGGDAGPEEVTMNLNLETFFYQ